jgi:hypothetical protein
MTPTLIKEMFTEFASKSDAYVQLYIDQAILSVNANIWGVKSELGIAYLTAHLMTMVERGGAGKAGNMTSEKVGDLQRSYGPAMVSLTVMTTEFHMTNYGAEFVRLRKSLPITPIVL